MRGWLRWILLGAGISVGACVRGPSRPPQPPQAYWQAAPPQAYWPPAPMRPPPVAAAPPGTPQSTTVGAPLPVGWAWPVNPFAIARGLAANTVYRPVNVAALNAMRGTSPCAPVEVAPSVWVTPLCERLPSLSLSPRARPRPMSIRGNAELPASVDLRARGLDGPVKHQQGAGVCWSFAISSLMDNGLRRAGRLDVFAPLHVIAHDEFKLLYQNGAGRPLVGEPSWPYDPHKACKLDENVANGSSCEKSYGIRVGTWREDPALVEERKQADAAGTYKIIAHHPLRSKPGNPDEIAGVLVDGQAIYASVEINMKVWSLWKGQGGGVIPDWQPDGTGGHAVVLSGYRMTPAGRQFLLHNSWGTDWADGGYAWISEAMIRERLLDAFVVTVGDAAGNPLPQAAPPPTPTPSPQFPFPFPIPAPQAGGCPAGQVRDAMLGSCSGSCPGGAAPVAGFCPPGGGGGAPAPPPSNPASACPSGQLPDVLTTVCSPACSSGAARAGGVCWQ